MGVPLPKGGANAAGDDGGLIQMMGPPLPAAGSRFQQSIDTQRANDANKAATFASMAPLPAGGGAGYTGAYGVGAEAGQQAQAARAAYVGNQNAVANQNSGNFFANQGYAHDANARENATNAAGTALTGAQTGAINSSTQEMIKQGPYTRDRLAAGTNAIDTEANQMMLDGPLKRNHLAAETDAIDAGTAAHQAALPFMAPLTKAQLEAQQLQNQRYGAETPGIVAGAADAASQKADILKQKDELLRQEQAQLKQKYDGTPPPADPNAAVNAAAVRDKAANEMGERDYAAQPLWKRSLPVFGMSKPEAIEAARARLPQVGGAAPAVSGAVPGLGAPAAIPANDPHPEGSVYRMPDGRAWVKQGGKWVQSR